MRVSLNRLAFALAATLAVAPMVATAGNVLKYPATGMRVTPTPTTPTDPTTPETPKPPEPAVKGVLTLSDTSLSFGSLRVGQSSSVQGVTVSNTGDGPLALTGISLASALQSAYFGTSNNCGSTLAPTETCQVNILYTASAGGAQTGQVLLNSTGGAGAIALSGYGLSPTLSVSEHGLLFPETLIGTDATALPVTLTNTGNAPVLVSSSALQGNSAFSLNGTCQGSLAPQASCVISVQFRPAATENSAVLHIVSDALDAPTIDVPVNGAGQAPASLGLSGTSVSFAAASIGTLSAESKTVTLTNSGGAPLTISSVSVPTGGTAYSASGCVGTLPAGQQCTLTVAFTPRAVTNAGVLRIVSNAANGTTQNITLSGTGTPSQAITLDTTAVAFTSAGIGVQSSEVKTVTVTNSGGSNLAISGVTVPTGATAYSATGCVGTLTPGQQCAVTVRFTPQAATNAGVLRITSDATNGTTKDVPLSGAGTASPLLTVTSVAPAFASAAIGYQSAETKTVTLKNSGTAALSVTSIAFTTVTTVYARSGNCTNIAAGASCSFTLTFTPSAVSNPATLRVVSNALNTPTQDIAVTGVGRNAGTMTITKAVYGLNVTIASAGNLTSKLQTKCNGKAVCVFDPFDVLGSDPSPGNAKNMALTYTCTTTGATVQSYNAGAEAGLTNHTLSCP